MRDQDLGTLRPSALPDDVLLVAGTLAVLIVSILGVLHDPLFGIGTLVVLVVVASTLVYPVSGILAVVLLTPFESLLDADFNVLKGLKLAILGFVTLRLLSDAAPANGQDPYRHVFYLFLIPACVSTLLAPSPLHSAIGLFQMAMFWGYYLIVGRTVTRERTAEWILNGVIWVSVPVSVLAALQSFEGYRGFLASGEQKLMADLGFLDTYWPSIQRASATFGSPNAAGAFFSAAALIALLHALIVPKGRLRYLLVTVTTCLGLAMTFSRGAILGLCCGLFFLMLVIGQARLRWMVTSAIISSVLLVFLLVPLPELLGYLRVGDDAISTSALRVLAWQTALRIIREHPAHGIGFYEFKAEAEDYADYSGDLAAPSHPHNGVLKATVEEGVLGGIAYIGYVIVFLRTSVSSIRRSSRQPRVLWIFASICAVGVCFFIQELVDAGLTMGGSSVAILFATLLGVQTGLSNRHVGFTSETRL